MCIRDRFMTLAAGGITRERRSRELIKHKYEKYGKCNTQDLINILRDHGDEENYNEKQESTLWRPDKSKNTICLHARDPLIRRTQTVCSLAAKVGGKGHFYYTTGVSNPCLSPFFPIFLNDTAIPVSYTHLDVYKRQGNRDSSHLERVIQSSYKKGICQIIKYLYLHSQYSRY